MISEVRLRVPVSREDHSQGPETAPLVLVEYGDYECPFCARAFLIVKHLQEMLKEDLRFVFRNFPLSQIHSHALNAARVAEAAAFQNKFWKMHDTLYENQKNLDDENLLGFAMALGVNLEKFIQDMESRKVEGRIESDLYEAV